MHWEREGEGGGERSTFSLLEISLVLLWRPRAQKVDFSRWFLLSFRER